MMTGSFDNRLDFLAVGEALIEFSGSGGIGKAPTPAHDFAGVARTPHNDEYARRLPPHVGQPAMQSCLSSSVLASELNPVGNIVHN